MTQQEFEFQMKRMQSHYGRNHFSDEKIKLIGPVVATVPADDFLTWVNNQIKFNDRAPRFEDFVRLGRSFERERHVQKMPSQKCQSCWDTGMLHVDNGQYSAVVRCECPHGAQQPPELRTRSDALSAGYRVVGPSYYKF